jgi:hypothetical protein
MNKHILKDVETSQVDEKEQEYIKFWHYDKNSHLKISHTEILELLNKMGFRVIELNTVNNRIKKLIKIIRNIAREVDISDMRRELICYIDSLPEKLGTNVYRAEVKEVFLRGIQQYLNDAKLSALEYIEPRFIRDEKDKMFFPFKNGIVVVDRIGVKLINYADFDGLVWEDSIIKHNIRLLDMNLDILKDGDFYKFTQYIVSNPQSYSFDPQKPRPKPDYSRWMALRNCIGYLLHNYKHPANMKAIILSETSLDDNPQGRSGKGLIHQAISKLRKSIVIDGKVINERSPFFLQQMSVGVDVIFLDDLQKNFNFETLFSMISEGVAFEQKNQGRIHLSPEESPKFTLATNFALRNTDSGSAKARMYQMELYTFFSNERTPYDVFGHYFFTDWDIEQWNLFYNFMFYCSYEYIGMELKIFEYESTTIAEKELIFNTSAEFIEFMDDYFGDRFEHFPDGFQCSVNSISEGFNRNKPIKYVKSTTQIGKWLDKYCKVKNIKKHKRQRKMENSIKETVWTFEKM